jgi:AraC-like DNA-binding protein
VRFAAESTAIVLSRASLDLPIEIARAFPPLADGSGPGEAVAARARRVVRSVVTEQAPIDLNDLASRLGVGPRSLQRALIGEGTNFRELVDEARVDAAAHLLMVRPDLSVKEVAIRIGFGGTSAFARAFRRRTGLSPSDYRRSHASRSARLRIVDGCEGCSVTRESRGVA